MKTTSLLYVLLAVFILSACKKDNDNPDPIIVQPTSFKLSKSTLSLAKGGREKLLIIITPVDATISKATWSISDQAIATIDKDGVIAAVSPGNTIVTLTVGDKTEQCVLDVVESPLSGLIMPPAKYPIAKGANIVIYESGFQTGNKIWLRRNDNSGGGTKSAQSDPDILATILEQAQTHIKMAIAVSDGWYSVILDNSKNQFNLGNIQIETPVIPEFAYDKTKIYWDDTDWRRLQLRGKVKEMTINNFKYKNNLQNETVIYKFNQLGHLESFVSETDSVLYGYDDNDRLTNITRYGGLSYNRHISQTWDYSYGTHEMYYPLTIEWAFNSSSSYWGIINSDLENREIWVKGLIGIRHESFGNLNGVHTQQFEVSPNSIVVTMHSPSQSGSMYVSNKNIYTYNGAFPVTDESWNYALITVTIHGFYTFQFSTTGMPVKVSYATPETAYGDEINYYENTPFCLASNLLGSSSTGTYSASSEYDNNWNLIKYTSTIYDDLYLINYVSYDKTGNWTVCNVNSNGYMGVWTVTRDISYW